MTRDPNAVAHRAYNFSLSEDVSVGNRRSESETAAQTLEVDTGSVAFNNSCGHRR
jgi:hypothetical protein